MKELNKTELMDNALKTLVPIIVPYAAKFITKLIPADSKLEDVLKNYKEYWNKVTPLVSLLVLQFTDMPELADDIVAQLSIEVARTIENKYSAEGNKLPIQENHKNRISISSAMASASKDDFVKLINLLKSVSEEQRRKILLYNLESEETAKAFISTLSSLEKQQFKDWVKEFFPTNKPKEEKKPKEENKSKTNPSAQRKGFADRMRDYLAEETWLEKFAKKRRLT